MATEKYNFDFLVLGESNSGKTKLILRIIENRYDEPKSQFELPVMSKTITSGLGNGEIKCHLYDTPPAPVREKRYDWAKNTFKTKHVVLLTIDMTDKDGLKKAEEWIGLVELHGRSTTPIIIVGTKSDDKSNQRITEKQLKEFVAQHMDTKYTENVVVGPRITSAKKAIGADTELLLFAREMAIRNNPDLKAQRAKRTDAITTKILPDLEAYTSGFNKFIAWLKAIFSLGQFTLGLKKQNQAEKLKAKLKQAEIDAYELVEKYSQKNKRLVSNEIRSSNLFVKTYIKQQVSGEVELNKGDLGDILDSSLSHNKK